MQWSSVASNVVSGSPPSQKGGSIAVIEPRIRLIEEPV
jgi:hypothetical protein